MQFSQIPHPYAPLGGPLRYRVEQAAGNDLEVRITDPAKRLLYGAKHFARVTEAEFDIAPYLRRALHFTPAACRTGLYDAGDRTLTAVVEVTDAVTRELITSDARCFLPAAGPSEIPALLTAMPRTRLIQAGRSDELTLCTDRPVTISLAAEYGPHVVRESYPAAGAGTFRFLLNTADYPDADRITVDAESCGSVTYAIVPPVEGAVRLAWRSSAGSIEHYDFPVELAASVEAEKHAAYGLDGYLCRAAAETRRTLRSALEQRAVLEALAELIHSPEVWIAEEADYTPVDVVSDRATVHRHGSLGTLDLVIRPKHKPALPWN